MTTAHVPQWQHFRFFPEGGAITPGSEISSAAHSGLRCHFLKIAPEDERGVEDPEENTALGTATPPPAWGLQVTRVSRPRGGPRGAGSSPGPPRHHPPQLAPEGTGGRHPCQSPQVSVSGTRVGHWKDPRRPEASPGKAGASGEPRTLGPRPRPSHRHGSARRNRGGRGPGPLSLWDRWRPLETPQDPGAGLLGEAPRPQAAPCPACHAPRAPPPALSRQHCRGQSRGPGSRNLRPPQAAHLRGP